MESLTQLLQEGELKGGGESEGGGSGDHEARTVLDEDEQ